MTKLSANFFLGALFFHVNGLCYEGANFQAIAGGCDDFRENLDRAGKREFDAAYNEMEKAFDDEMDAEDAHMKSNEEFSADYFLGALHFLLLGDNSQAVLEDAIYSHKVAGQSICLTEDFLVGAQEMTADSAAADELAGVWESSVEDITKEIKEATKLGIYSKTKSAKMLAYCEANPCEVAEYRMNSMRVADAADLIAALV